MRSTSASTTSTSLPQSPRPSIDTSEKSPSLASLATRQSADVVALKDHPGESPAPIEPVISGIRPLAVAQGLAKGGDGEVEKTVNREGAGKAENGEKAEIGKKVEIGKSGGA